MLFRSGGGERGHDDALLRERHVGEAHRPALGDEEPAEVELLGRARARGGVFVGLRVDADVGEEPVEERGHA